MGFKLESQLVEIGAVQLIVLIQLVRKKTLIPPLSHAIAIASVTPAVLSNSHPNGDDPLQI